MYQYHSYENAKCIMLFGTLTEEDVIRIDSATFSYFKLHSTIIDMKLGSSFWSFSSSVFNICFQIHPKEPVNSQFSTWRPASSVLEYSRWNFDNLFSKGPRKSRKIRQLKPPSKLFAGLRKFIIFQYSFLLSFLN